MKQRIKDNVALWALCALLVACLIAPTAWGQSLDQAILEWDSSGPLAQEYRIYRADAQVDGSCAPAPNGYTQIGAVPASTLTYTDGPLAYNESFCWYVTAWNIDKPESGASNLVTKRIPFPASPPAPANLRVR